MGAVHAKNILASSSFELVGIVEPRDGDIFAGLADTRNAGKLDLPLDRLRATPVHKSLEDCVARRKPDAVVICAPLFLHESLTRKALTFGLDVLLEKPFCPEVALCRELIALAENAGRILMVAHCVRFSPPWEFLAAGVKDRRYGELRLLSTTRMGGEPTWGVWRDETIKKTCGGALMDLLIHDLDFIDDAVGAPDTVRINTRVGEYWEISLGFDGRASRVSVKGGFLPRNSPFVSEYAAIFDRAGIYFSNARPDILTIATDAGLETRDVSGDAYVAELAYFSACVESRTAPEKCPPLRRTWGFTRANEGTGTSGTSGTSGTHGSKKGRF